ncbi:chromosome 16 C19orf85 homolog [Epinephelus lanceolatus]
MRPSISVTLEPGLERGVPWGRDLHTFVTSAAGHMMRTLQKPRKNRPSKRQVNHRRFLHNMIQRKFADIEAGNHQLANALYLREAGNNSKSPPSQNPETLEQSGRPSHDSNKCNAHTDADGISKCRSDVSVGSHEADISEKKQLELGHLWKRHPKSQPSTCTTRKNNRNKERQKKETQTRHHKLVKVTPTSSPKAFDYHPEAELFYTGCYDEGQLKSANNLAQDCQTTQQDFIQFDQTVDVSPSFSPELSPLSLDLCDLSIQMFTGVSTCTQKSIADISESQWTDIMDLFGSREFGGCVDVDTYIESIIACQGDAGREFCADDVGFADQSHSFSHRSEVEDPRCETGEYRYEYSCHGDQGSTINQLQSNQRSSQAPRQNEDTQFNSFKPTQETDIIQNQFQTSISYDYNASELHMYQHPQEESPCLLVHPENIQNFTPFEGVAQSFSVPLCNPEHRRIPTPPQEGDWLFTDILKDRKSMEC